MTTCPNPNTLGAFAEGRLEGDERLSVLTHLNSCSRCRSEYVELMRFADQEENTVLAFTKKSKSPLWVGIGLAAAVFLAVLFWPAKHRDMPADWEKASWWMAQYGPLEDEALAQQVASVFNRMAASVPHKNPQLVLLAKAQEPIVLALEDHLVISQEALEMCYRNVDPLVGDARLALVLGHELEHLRLGETGHAFAAFEKLQGKTVPRHASEIHADQWGMVYAAQAGFDPHLMLNDSLEFLSLWRSGDALKSHPNAFKRADALKHQLTEVANKLDDFHYGNRLYQMGRFKDAALLLERFNQHFRSRESLNNLGLIELGMASRALAACDVNTSLRFKLPFILDNQSVLEGTRRRGEQSKSPCYGRPDFKTHLDKAVHYFEAALKLDPQYRPAQMNLMASYLLAADGTAALAMSGDLPDTPAGRIAQALAFYLFSLDQPSPAEDQAEALAMLATMPDHAAANYNRAAILAETGAEPGDAMKQFLALESIGPYADRAREFLDIDPINAQQEILPNPAAIPLGALSDASRQKLNSMTARELQMGDQQLNIYQQNTLSVVTLADKVILVEQITRIQWDALPTEVHRAQRLETSRGFINLGPDWMIETAASFAIRDIRFLPKPQGLTP